MRLHRFYIGGEKGGKNEGFSVFEGNGVNRTIVKKKKNLAVVDTSETVVLDGGMSEQYSSIIHQWKNVFRYTVGSRVVLFDDSGVECVCIIESIGSTGDKANLVVLEKISKRNASNAANAALETTDSKDESDVSVSSNVKKDELWMFVSILKNDNFDLITQKMTELSVDHVVPLLCDRTIKKNVNMTRLEKIAIEAAEQSGRTSVPVIHEPIELKKAIENFLADGGEVIVCHQDGQLWSKSVGTFKKYPLGFIVGPEGGWSEKEEAYFEKNALRKVKFSDNVLRAETAAISVVALVRVG